MTLTLIFPCSYTEAYRSLWVGDAWTTEPLFFTLDRSVLVVLAKAVADFFGSIRR